MTLRGQPGDRIRRACSGGKSWDLTEHTGRNCTGTNRKQMAQGSRRTEMSGPFCWAGGSRTSQILNHASIDRDCMGEGDRN